ncbi:MAG: RHS repeat-associated core domain-containing protein [Tepidisphaeraceae bacterium]
MNLAPRDLYYSKDWQVLEERAVYPDSGNVQPVNQYVWGLAYVDEMVLRDRDSNGLATGNYGISGSGLDERLYVLQDANWNTIALANMSQQLVENFIYDPYAGNVAVLTGNESGAATGEAYGWSYFHQGGRVDPVSGLYSFRHRDYSPTLGRWGEEDPLKGIRRGKDFRNRETDNWYLYLQDNPIDLLDPRGTQSASSSGQNFGPNEHQSYQTFSLQCPAGQIVSNISLDTSGMSACLLNAMQGTGITSPSGSDDQENEERLQQLLHDINGDFSDISDSGSPNCAGNPVIVKATMRTRLVNDSWGKTGWEAWGYRFYYGLPSAAAAADCYQQSVTVNYTCDCCK